MQEENKEKKMTKFVSLECILQDLLQVEVRLAFDSESTKDRSYEKTLMVPKSTMLLRFIQ